jgi:Ras-related GTP-binding protein A/B
MDLVSENKRVEIFNKRKNQLEQKAGNFKIQCFPTSIWEISLYKAWTNIVSELTMNLKSIKQSLKNFSQVCGVEEVILFEKNTFLLLCSFTDKEIKDEQRFEKISHIIKKFKLSCMTTNSRFESMIIQTRNYTTYLDEFTSSTYIMVIINSKNTNLELIKLNVALCRKTFEEKLNGKDENKENNDDEQKEEN